MQRRPKAMLNAVSLEVEDIDLHASVRCSASWHSGRCFLNQKSPRKCKLPRGKNRPWWGHTASCTSTDKTWQGSGSTSHSSAGPWWPVRGCPTWSFPNLNATVGWVPEIEICIQHFSCHSFETLQLEKIKVNMSVAQPQRMAAGGLKRRWQPKLPDDANQRSGKLCCLSFVN